VTHKTSTFARAKEGRIAFQLEHQSVASHLKQNWQKEAKENESIVNK